MTDDEHGSGRQGEDLHPPPTLRDESIRAVKGLALGFGFGALLALLAARRREAG